MSQRRTPTNHDQFALSERLNGDTIGMATAMLIPSLWAGPVAPCVKLMLEPGLRVPRVAITPGDTPLLALRPTTMYEPEGFRPDS